MPSPEAFYLHLQGEQRGPYTIPQIDHLLNSGLIAEETLYWREGLEQWQPVTSLVRLRRKANPWLKPLIYGGICLLLAIMGQFFGSIALVGWREMNQHEYTVTAAYWRARSAIRTFVLPTKAVVDFEDFSEAEVELLPPHGAVVTVKGEVEPSAGQVRSVVWR